MYDVVAEWVAQEYGVKRGNFVRPFKPDGDYQKEKYKKNDVVVDNPPFSILAEILKFYNEEGIKYFLFGPTLTLFSSSSSSSSFSSFSSSIVVGATVIYENGAKVNTSFLTNLEPEEIITAAMLSRLCKYGQDIRFRVDETKHVRQLDNADGGIYGSGYFISEKAAAEKAAAHVIELSEREKEIVRNLGNGKAKNQRSKNR